jgi:hypothetical protein
MSLTPCTTTPKLANSPHIDTLDPTQLRQALHSQMADRAPSHLNPLGQAPNGVRANADLSTVVQSQALLRSCCLSGVQAPTGPWIPRTGGGRLPEGGHLHQADRHQTHDVSRSGFGSGEPQRPQKSERKPVGRTYERIKPSPGSHCNCAARTIHAAFDAVSALASAQRKVALIEFRGGAWTSNSTLPQRHLPRMLRRRIPPKLQLWSAPKVPRQGR